MCSEFSQIKDRKYIEQNFHFVAKVMPWVGTVGAGGVKYFSVGICDGAPSTVRSSFLFSPRKHMSQHMHTSIQKILSGRVLTTCFSHQCSFFKKAKGIL